MHIDTVEEVRKEVEVAIKENVKGYLYIGAAGESLRAGYDIKSDGGLVFKKFFRLYADITDILVDEYGFVE